MDCKAKPDTKVVYMTTGVLLQILLHQKYQSGLTHIIIDEIHNRDIFTDLLLLVVKKMQLDRPSWKTKIILLSATIDASQFVNYFSHTDVKLLSVPDQERVNELETLFVQDIERKLVSMNNNLT